MNILDEALSTVTPEHAAALAWFNEHRGQIVAWSTIAEHAAIGPRLANQAKGIYKPHYTDFALSVRQTLNSPYADKEVIRRPDGSWVYPYFQENPNPAERDKEATNRGLVRCMEQGVPVGVLQQTQPKPGVQYMVLGLAIVTDWKDGYFILEGLSDQGELMVTKHEPDAAHDRAEAIATTSFVESFSAGDILDTRVRQIAEVVRRRGQARFRTHLVEAYKGRCAISGCNAVEALEAAHILPYRGSQTDHVQNGLLLRADLHSLFDLGLLSINPKTMTVVLAPQISSSSYEPLTGKVVAVPNDPTMRPDSEALEKHLIWTGIALE